MARAIMTVVTDTTNSYLLTQNLKHGIQHGTTLSAAKIARALMTGCANAIVPLADQPDEKDLTAWIAGVFKRYTTETLPQA